MQRRVPDEMRGRVFTWLDVVWNVMKVLSLSLGGWLAERAGIEMVYYIGGAMLVLSGLSGIALLRDERLV
jgi:MFS family permease